MPNPAVLAFAETAKSYCTWCESAPRGASDSQVASWLSTLYSLALNLPTTEPKNPSGLPALDAQPFAQAQENLSHFSGRYYRECFDPDPLKQDPPCLGDIGDDLLDIYKDLKAGLQLFEQGQSAEALWHWSFLFQAHWGRHAVGALFALHCLSISNGTENAL